MHSSVIFLLLMLAPARAPVELAQLTIEQRVIIRVPITRQPSRLPTPVAKLKEKKGPRCLAIRSLRAAGIAAQNGIDLILSNGERYRARLEKSCPAVDFWSGFYIEPTKDGSLCAERDSIQARGGTECEIKSFKQLVEDE
ncbi:hypothetical protein BH10PSE12_BH10PSE12_37320 [soil metagenome]